MICVTPGQRIVGLNAWRAILMMVGVLLHAGLWLPRTPLSRLIDLSSGSFRMGCFFVISGMLSGLSLRGKRAGEWMRRRLVQIGVPTLVGLALICPLLTSILKLIPATLQGSPPVWLDWYHCWFLVALLGYAGLAWAAETADRRWGWLARVDARVGASPVRLQLPILLWLAVLVFGLMSITSAIVAATVPPDHLHAAGQLRFIVGYAPIYAFGFLLARAPAFSRCMLASRWRPALLLALVAIVYLRQFCVLPLVGGGTSPLGDFMVRAGGAALSPAAAAVLILRSALAIRRVPPLLDRLCDASFTIYLVHMPIIAALSAVIARLSWNPHLALAAIAVTTAVVGYVFHAGLVRRWVTLSLLLNGRRPTAPRPLPGHPASDPWPTSGEALA